MPERIQRHRNAGGRMPEGTVYVGRPTKYGNPITLSDVSAQYPSLDETQIATLAVRDFEVLATHGTLHFPNWRFHDGRRGPATWTYPPVSDIRRDLAGRDLACWCPLTQLCHADVLLQIANAPPCPECGPGYRYGDDGCRHKPEIGEPS